MLGRPHPNGPSDVQEALAEAWLVLTQGCRSIRWFALPQRRGAPPRPRIVGVRPQGGYVAVVPGPYLDHLVQTRRGFAQTVRYLRAIAALLGPQGTATVPGSPRLVAWALDGAPRKQEVIERAAHAAGAPLEFVLPRHAADVTRSIAEAIGRGERAPNLVVEGWKWLLEHGGIVPPGGERP